MKLRAIVGRAHRTRQVVTKARAQQPLNTMGNKKEFVTAIPSELTHQLQLLPVRK